MKTALISVSDKTGIVEFARKLADNQIRIISTGGTKKVLQEQGIPVIGVDQITGFEECFDGRVKTLHPKICGGVLARRDVEQDRITAERLDIPMIDYIVINLYPFKQTIRQPGVLLEQAMEQIDIGGPTLLRSGAKNHQFVTTIIDRQDYDRVIEQIEAGGVSPALRKELAIKVFEHTAAYDAVIAEYLRADAEPFPERLTLTYQKQADLRYGENPHQSAAFYKEVTTERGIASLQQIHGKELSFNNINDASSALDLLGEFEQPTVVALKHTNPCGVGVGEDLLTAYNRAYECDPQSIFGGIIACNRTVDRLVAERINQIFIEIVVAPDFTDEAVAILSAKKNIRLLINHNSEPDRHWDLKKVSGGILVQQQDDRLNDQIEVVTTVKPTLEQTEAMILAMKVCKHIKSNGIVFANQYQTLSIGPGQTSRVWALQNAVRNTFLDLKDSVMASDAFFPFDDCVEIAARVGTKAIIQPGGSVRDADSIEKANQHQLAMIFTGTRHFKH